jgi:PAS domain S-box-containing protein
MRAPEVGRTSGIDYRAICDALHDAILIHEVETGAILEVNQRMCEMFGYSRESAGRLNIADLSGGDSRGARETLRRLLAKTVSGEIQPFEWRAKTSSGQLFWAEVHLKRAVLNGIERGLAVIRDISQRRQAEEALKESEARFRLVTEGSLAGVYLIQGWRRSWKGGWHRRNWSTPTTFPGCGRISGSACPAKRNRGTTPSGAGAGTVR